MNKILLDAQINEYNKKLALKPNNYDTPQDKTYSTPTAPPQLRSLQNSHLLSLVLQNYRNTLAITEHTSQGSNFPRSPVSHITLHRTKY